MQNNFIAYDDGEYDIELKRRGKTSVYARVDEEGFKIAVAFPGRWYSFIHPRTKAVMVRGYYQGDDGQRIEPLLHRIIAKPEKGENTMAVSGDWQDCRLNNLVNMPIKECLMPFKSKGETPAETSTETKAETVETTTETTTQNMAIPTGETPAETSVETMLLHIISAETGRAYLEVPNTTTPVRGVSFHKGKQKWEAKANYNGQRISLGYFPADELQRANMAVAELARLGPDAYFEKYPKKGGKR